MIVSHVRDAKNIIYATLVAVSPDKIGLTVRNPADQCSKRLARTIAEARAHMGVAAKIPNRTIVSADNYSESLESAITFEYYSLKARAEKYFKVVSA